LEYRPFDPLQIIDTNRIYDFHNDTVDSRKRYLLDNLAGDYRVHDAIRILNKDNRNYSRDYKPLLTDTTRIKERLQASYLDGLQKFFSNQEPDLSPTTGSGPLSAISYGFISGLRLDCTRVGNHQLRSSSSALAHG
jgi:hypothetical protein